VVYSVRNNNYYYKVKLKKLNRDIRPKPIRHKLTTSHNMLATAEITNKNQKNTDKIHADKTGELDIYSDSVYTGV